MADFLHSYFFEALGWSLIDSLWQNGILWGCYCLLTLNGKKFSSSARHNISLLLITSGTLWFFITLLNYAGGSRLYSVSSFLKDGIDGINHVVSLSGAMPILSFLYLLMILIYAARLLLQQSAVNFFHRRALLHAGDQVSLSVQHLSEKMGISRKVQVWISSKICTPLTVGIFKPVILLPVAIVNQLSVPQLQAVIAHELHHIRKYDYALNIVLVFSEIILFFNPFTNMLASIARKEREHRCDDQVLSMGFNAWEYSEALYIISNNGNQQEYRLALAAAGSGKKILLQRIKRLLKIKQPSPSFVKPLFTFFLCLSVAVFAGRNSSGVSVIKSTANSNEIAPTIHHVLVLTRPEPIIIEEQKNIEEVRESQKLVRKETRKRDLQDGLGGKSDAPTLNVLSDVYLNYPSFVSDKELLEFTIIEPEVPELPSLNTGRPLPYVPGSTFYTPLDTLIITVQPEKVIIRI